MTPPETQHALSSIAALAAEHGALSWASLPSFAQHLTALDRLWRGLDLWSAARLGGDLHAIDAGLGALLALAGPSPQHHEVAALRARVLALRAALKASADASFVQERARLRAGGLRGAELIAWLAAQPVEQRDLALEHLLDIAYRPLGERALHPDLVDYIPSGIAPIVRAVMEAPIGPEDVFVDIGSGLGKVTMAVHLLSGARAQGVEVQDELVAIAEQRAQQLDLVGVSYVTADARSVDLSAATVIFLYLPFTGETLAAVMRKIEAAARQRSLVVCTLGLDLSAQSWLRERSTAQLWLSVYDTCCVGVAPRPSRQPPPLGAAAEAVASEASRV